MTDSTSRTPITLCWHCDRALDAATPVDDDDPVPTPGAISLCLYCGAVGIFGDELVLRPPTEAELDEMGQSTEFRMQYHKFIWVRQYAMLKESLMRGDRTDPDK